MDDTPLASPRRRIRIEECIDPAHVDGHRKPVYSDTLIPRGLVGRLGAILGCRALVLLHDEQGHPLLATTHRGDQHLMVGLPSIIERYEHSKEHVQVKRVIVDREGMGTEFLASLHAEGRTVVTILHTNQYQDLTSFCDVGTFLPLSTNATGQIIREVAPARITVALPDHPDEQLCLQVALIRDLRRSVAVRPDQEDDGLPRRWDADRERTDLRWWEEGWQATAAPAKEMTAKLIPIVTTAPTIDAVELAQTYIHRWPAQENVIKDYSTFSGIGHQPWFRQGCGGELGDGQATNPSAAAPEAPAAMGTECWQTRGPGKPTT